ncbi:MAG: tyrosine-type recombinase/integrase [Crocinitomicaceae bacterium]|nr:tyrosine-type recombinase/integrase [Crocinitomicaceae bacterium]
MLDGFIDYLTTQKRFSEHTCLAYHKDIKQFLEFADIDSIEDLKEVDSRLVRGWMVDLIENDYLNNSVNRKLSSLRTYFKWLVKEQYLKSSPMQMVKGPKNQKRLPSFAQRQELDEAKTESLFTEDFDGVRDRLMFEMFYQTGIRSSELIGLIDIDVNSSQIKVLGKRSKERVIPISKDFYKLVEGYRSMRLELHVTHGNFFVLNNGKKLYEKFVYRKINRYLGKATGLEKKSPHVLRHTFATHMLNNGAGLEVLKELLGHASLSATQVYTHNSFAEITSIYSQSHPRGQKK